MDFLNLTGIAGLFWMTLCINPTIAWFKEWWEVTCIYRRTGRFGDGRGGNDDWVNRRDPATGKYSLVKIAEYIAPKDGPKSGGIVIHSRDKDGNVYIHPPLPLKEWEASMKDLRRICNRQAKDIREAGNDWPRMPERKEIDLAHIGGQLINALKDNARSADSLGSRTSALNTSIKRQLRRNEG